MAATHTRTDGKARLTSARKELDLLAYLEACSLNRETRSPVTWDDLAGGAVTWELLGAGYASAMMALIDKGWAETYRAWAGWGGMEEALRITSAGRAYMDVATNRNLGIGAPPKATKMDIQTWLADRAQAEG